MNNVILILDKSEYKNKEKNIKMLFSKKCDDIKIYYTEYEDDLIRTVSRWKYIGEIFLHLLYWLKSFKYAFQIGKDSEPSTIISINPIVGIFLGALNRNKKHKIVLCGFLFEPKKSKIYYSARIAVVKWFLKGISEVVVYSTKEVEYYNNIFGDNKFKFIQYGIDYDSHEKYNNSVLKNPFIFSGGRSNRDYKTLLEAFHMLNSQIDIPLYIATRPVVLQGLDMKNVNVMKDVVLETFGDVIERSMFVVLPLKDGDISAGHQVMLEALERNKIIIINNIKAVTDYVSEDQVIFYESANAVDLYNKIKYAIDNFEELSHKYKNNSKYYSQNFTFVCFMERIIKEFVH